MIKDIEIRNFKSIKEAKIDFSNFSIIVGRNAVGKSNLIQAIKFIRDLARGRTLKNILGEITLVPNEFFNFNEPVHYSSFRISIIFKDNKEYIYSLSLKLSEDFELFFTDEKLEKKIGDKSDLIFIRKGTSLEDKAGKNIPLALDSDKSAASQYKDPDTIEFKQFFRNMIISDTDIEELRDSIGHLVQGGLAGALLRMKEKDPKAIENFNEIIAKLVPQYSSIVDSTLTTSGEEKYHLILLKEKDIEDKLSMKLLSAGDLRTLYIVASAMGLENGSTLIVEEIENGLHPFRLRLLLEQLYAVGLHKDLQVIFTTHSPLAINRSRPSDVIFAKKENDKGTQFQRLSENRDIVNIEGFLQSGGELSELINSQL